MKSASSSVSFPLLGSAALALMLAACSSNVPLNEPAEKTIPIKPDTSSQNTKPQSAVVPVAPAEPARSTEADVPRIVYFDYDSYAIKDEFRGVVDANAKRLTSAPAKHAVIEGHTDERGGSEYNLALGQKRAEAVVKALTLLGAKSDQLEAVSFGKERPAVEGHDEAAWAKNRRAELKDR